MLSRIKSLLRKIFNRKVQLIVIDCAIMVMSCVFTYLFVNSLEFVDIKVGDVFLECVLFAGLNMLFMALFKTYRNMWRYARIGEFSNCIFAVISGSVISWIITMIFKIHVSTIFTMLLFFVALFGIIFSRCIYYYLYRIFKNYSNKESNRTLIIGAGNAGRELLGELLYSTSEKYKPVAIVDDDFKKIGRSINSVPIVGKTKSIPKIVEKYNIKNIIFAIPSCSAKDKKRIFNICAETNCVTKSVPSLSELVDMNNLVAQMKPIKIEDLLGREVVKLDIPRLEETIKGRVCMVTGGGGSIGSELSRQIAKNKPKTLVIVDIYENNAYDIQQELLRTYKDSLDLRIEIASVRDYDKMKVIFEEYKPELVFHAAAHKHVPLMETNPEEAVKNNIFGTFNTVKLAAEYKVDKFVLVSTDKAVNPTNVMGATKRCCEMIVQYMAQKKTDTDFIAVRFGNVLGSNGSVIPLFERQIAENKPITVTDPEIIRYFMTIPEAASLILEAVTIACGGEIFVLDMGEPVKILTLAENLIRMHGKEPYTEVKIEFTGLRPGEKLYEELLMDEEGLRQTAKDRIFIGQQIKVDPTEFEEKLDILKGYAESNNTCGCVRMLCEIVPTFKTAQDTAEVS